MKRYSHYFSSGSWCFGIFCLHKKHHTTWNCWESEDLKTLWTFVLLSQHCAAVIIWNSFTFGTHKTAPRGRGWFHWIITPFITPTYSSFYGASHLGGLLSCVLPKLFEAVTLPKPITFLMKAEPPQLRTLPLCKRLSKRYGLLHPLVWTEPSTPAKKSSWFYTRKDVTADACQMRRHLTGLQSSCNRSQCWRIFHVMQQTAAVACY